MQDFRMDEPSLRRALDVAAVSEYADAICGRLTELNLIGRHPDLPLMFAAQLARSAGAHGGSEVRARSETRGAPSGPGTQPPEYVITESSLYLLTPWPRSRRLMR